MEHANLADGFLYIRQIGPSIQEDEDNMKMLSVVLLVMSLSLTVILTSTLSYATNESSYRTGYEHGVNDTKTNLYLYDSTNACNDINYTSSQIYSCLKGYENAQILVTIQDTYRVYKG